MGDAASNTSGASAKRRLTTVRSSVRRNPRSRLVALAEVLWSPPETRDLASFKSRLETHLERLAILDVNYRGRFRPPD